MQEGKRADTTRERWQQIKQIFDEALKYEPPQRAVYLTGACASDPSLREEVESLLASRQKAEQFLEAPASAANIHWAEEVVDSVTGQRIGAYRVIRQIGHGGMGAVYLAERADDQFHQQAAIKLVKRGMDTDFILNRFLNQTARAPGEASPGVPR